MERFVEPPHDHLTTLLPTLERSPILGERMKLCYTFFNWAHYSYTGVCALKKKTFLLLILILFLTISCGLFASKKLSGYINQAGNYGFNYPASWKAFETRTNVFFEFEEGKVECSVRPIAPGETYETIQSEFEPVYFYPRFSTLVVANEPALQNDHIGLDGKIVGRTYFIIHNNLLYTVALYTDPEATLPKNFSTILNQFENLITSFRFLN